MVILLERVARYLDLVYFETGWSVAKHLSSRFSAVVAHGCDALGFEELLACLDDFADLYYDAIVRVGCLTEDGERIMLAIDEALPALSQQRGVS